MNINKLRSIFLLSIPLFIVHGIEEYFTGFYKVDEIFFGRLSPSISQPAFAIFQIIWWSLLIKLYKLGKRKWSFNLLIFIGFVYLFELHHLIHTFFIEKSYYPGTFTALGFPILAVLFWKELLKGKQYGRS